VVVVELALRVKMSHLIVDLVIVSLVMAVLVLP
jgi:hypothetical protein